MSQNSDRIISVSYWMLRDKADEDSIYVVSGNTGEIDSGSAYAYLVGDSMYGTYELHPAMWVECS